MLGALLLGQACSLGGDDEELGQVELGPPRLLDDGAGQRHYEVSYPAGKPRATILFIHGGGWLSHGVSTFAATQTEVDRLTSEGFRVVAISTDESPQLSDGKGPADGGRVLDDVLAFHDQVGDAFPDEPICAHGISGGGHLALLLAVERPDLHCASAAGPPTDLLAQIRDARLGSDPDRTCSGSQATANIGFKIGACLAILTWGTGQPALRRGSPALRWPDSLETEVWAGFEQRDPVIPPSQRAALRKAVDSATIEILRPDPKGPTYVHGGVREADEERATRSWIRWLDEVVPTAEGEPSLPDDELREGAHEACNSRLAEGPPSWRQARRRDRADLLDAAGRWRPQSESVALPATSSCDGRQDLQESGLTLWAPGFTADGSVFVEQGESASWVFTAPEGSAATSISAAFRGFIANPGVWRLGLYVRRGEGEWTSLFECDGRDCGEVAVQPAAEGVTIVPAGSRPGSDERQGVPTQAFDLGEPATEVKWQLECVAKRGCLPSSINPGSSPTAPKPARPIDPTGRPAVLSLYELTVTTVEN